MSTPEETDHKLQDLREAQRITRRASDPTPSAPSLQSVAEGAANELHEVFALEGFSEYTARAILTRHFAPVYAALTERDERIGRLERGQLEYRDAVVRLSAEIGNLSVANAALRTRCEELERDKERLDWMEANGAELDVEWDDGEAPLSWPEFRVRINNSGAFPTAKSHRAAIDAARKEGQQAHEKGEGK